MFNIETSLWENKTDYPFCAARLNDYSSVSINDFVLIIGGYCKKTEETITEVHSIIAKFRKNVWTQVGNLMIPRQSCPSPIQVQISSRVWNFSSPDLNLDFVWTRLKPDSSLDWIWTKLRFQF